MPRLFVRLLFGLLSLAAAVLVGGQPAWADATVTVDPARLPASAGTYPGPLCAEPGPADGDRWVFAPRDGLLGGAGELVVVTASFVDATNAVQTVEVPAAGTRAVVVTPPGWLLTEATAQVTGVDGQLDLVATCPATTRPGLAGGAETRPELIGATGNPPSSSPRAAVPPARPTPVIAATTPRAVRAPSSTPIVTPVPGRPPVAAVRSGAGGNDVVGMVALGSGVTLAVVLLIAVRRPRRPTVGPRPEPDDIRRAVVVAWRD